MMTLIIYPSFCDSHNERLSYKATMDAVLGNAKIIETHKRKSTDTTEGPERAPNRAMPRAIAYTDQDFKQPFVGAASTWNEVTPCNIHLNRVTKRVKEVVREALRHTIRILYNSCERRCLDGQRRNESVSREPRDNCRLH